LSGHAFGPPTLPRVGAWRKDLGAVAITYVNDLTAWDRIRELSRQQDVRDGMAKRWAWRKLFVRAMAAFFRAWEHSGYRIVPGASTEAIHDIMAPYSHGCVQRPLALYPWGAGTCGRWTLPDRREITQLRSLEMPLRIDLCAVLLDIVTDGR
jgi:hypothetical protein